MAERLPGEIARFAVRRAGTTMFGARSALEVLDWLEARGATVLGVDAFYLTNADTRPSIADSFGGGGIIEARTDKPLFFEIVTNLDI